MSEQLAPFGLGDIVEAVRDVVAGEQVSQLMGAGRPLRAHYPDCHRLGACCHRSPGSLAEQLRNFSVELKLWVAPRLVQVVIEMSERHCPHVCAASGDISVRNEQDPLRGRVELVARIEKVHAVGVSERLACHDQGDLITDVELGECSLGVSAVTMR